jgi:alkyldihydroxyacetonephosphate synthase
MSHPPRAAAYAQRIVPEPPAPQPPGEVSLDVWGFADSGFRVNEAGQVEFRGARYAFSGKVIPNLLPWAETILGLPLDPKQRRASGYPTALPERFGNEPLERRDPGTPSKVDERRHNERPVLLAVGSHRDVNKSSTSDRR